MTMIPGQILPNYDPAPLDDLLLEDHGLGRIPYGQRIRAIGASELAKVPNVRLRVWCHNRARYLVPTKELVDWLDDLIGGRPALEIGAGMGDLGRLLFIRMTDSAVQTTPDMRLYYELLGQPITEPPPDVERLEANEAVAKYRPRVVVGAWITQRYQPGDERPPKVESSVYGVDEVKLLSQIDTYIHIGNMAVHRQKRIFQQQHQTHRLPFLFTRAGDPSQNVVHVWNR